MKLHTARQIVSRFAVYDEKGRYIPPKDPRLMERLGHAKNTLSRSHKAEKRNKRLARRKAKGLH